MRNRRPQSIMYGVLILALLGPAVSVEAQVDSSKRVAPLRIDMSLEPSYLDLIDPLKVDPTVPRDHSLQAQNDLSLIQGLIVDTIDDAPVMDVTIDFGAHGAVTTSADGSFSIDLPEDGLVYYTASKSGYMTRKGVLSVPELQNTSFVIDLVSLTHPDFNLRAYKRLLFDRQASAPFWSLRFVTPPMLYIDETPDAVTGETFSEAQIDHITSVIPNFISAITNGLYSGLSLNRGTTPPTSHAIVYRLDSSISISAAAGGCSPGPICKTVNFKAPSGAESDYLLKHETGHSLGFAHTNGIPSVMTSSAIFYLPNDPFFSSNSETPFDLIAGEILYSRPRGVMSAIDIDTAIEYVPGPLPVLAYPLNGEKPLSHNNSILFGYAGDDLDGDYEIQISDGPSFDFNSDQIEAFNMGSGLQARLSPSRLNGMWERESVLYWRVLDRGAGITSEIDSFATALAIPSVPVLLIPSNDQTEVAIDKALIWRSPAGADTYHLQVSKNIAFTSTVIDTASYRSTGYTPTTELEPATLYYWRVRASNNAGMSDWSEIWSFSTVSFVAPPAAVTLTLPAHEAVDQNSTVGFSWQEQASVTSYHLQVSIASDFASLVFEDSTLSETSMEVGPLAYSTVHYWRVRAKNAGGIGPWSEVRSFTVAVGTATEQMGNELPEQYALYQNYPNPFNPLTTIRFDLPEPSDVSLTIYDLNGRIVEKLVSGSLAAGKYQVSWNANGYASGTYIYRLRTGNFNNTKVLILLK